MKNKEYEYKDDSVQGAIAQGLLDLNLTEGEVDIEILSEGGMLKKATVKVTPKSKEEEAPEMEAEDVELETETEDVELETETEGPARNKRSDEELSFKEIDPAIVEEVKEKTFQFVKGLIEIMGVDCEVEAKITDEAIVISIDGPEARIIIGRRGDVLDAIQFLALTVGNRDYESFIRISIDAENYREKRSEILKTVALNYSKKAVKFGEIVELEPMNPFERRIIHLTLQEDKTVVTRSEGEGRDRHVIIVPFDEDGKESTRRQPDTRYRDSNDDYGTSSNFRQRGAGRMKTYGAPKRRF